MSLCSNPKTMCKSCKKDYKDLKDEQIVSEIEVLIKPGAHPILFTACFTGTYEEVDNFMYEGKDKMEDRLTSLLSSPVSVLMDITRVTGREDSPLVIEMMIDFPREVSVDRKLMEAIFLDLPSQPTSWQCEFPTDCPSALRLGWFADVVQQWKGDDVLF